MPNIGLGARYQKGHYGVDLSANLGSLILFNYASLKGMFLYYPQPEKKHPLYLGIGPGLGYHLNAIAMPAPYGGCSQDYGSVTLEGVVGYEFRHTDHFKTFIQLELSQPTIDFAGSKDRTSRTPE